MFGIKWETGGVCLVACKAVFGSFTTRNLNMPSPILRSRCGIPLGLSIRVSFATSLFFDLIKNRRNPDSGVIIGSVFFECILLQLYCLARG